MAVKPPGSTKYHWFFQPEDIETGLQEVMEIIASKNMLMINNDHLLIIKKIGKLNWGLTPSMATTAKKTKLSCA